MSTLDSFRTVHPPLQAGAARSAPVASADTFQAALEGAAITIPQLLRQRAAMHGDALALREKDYGIWNPYSWRHYYETARAVALGLLSLGVKPGDRIAIAGENTPEWFYADLGTQMIGAVAVGIYPTNPWVELQYIVKHSGARMVVLAVEPFGSFASYTGGVPGDLRIGPGMAPGNKDGWSDEQGGWVTNTVGFAGPGQRFTLAVMNALNGAGGNADGQATTTRLSQILLADRQ